MEIICTTLTIIISIIIVIIFILKTGMFGDILWKITLLKSTSNNFTSEIIMHLEKLNLKLIEINDLKFDDFEKSSFYFNNASDKDFILFNMKYSPKLIIAQNDKNDLIKIWFRYLSHLSGENKYEFIIDEDKVDLIEFYKQKKNIKVINTKCPACSFNFIKDKLICPNCELHFE